MDPLSHGCELQFADIQPVAWTAVNQGTPTNAMPVKPSSPRPVVSIQTTQLPMSLVKSNEAVKTPITSARRPLLPRPLPSPIRKSVKPCLVCGRSYCTLSSHRHFAHQALTRRRSLKQQQQQQQRPPPMSPTSSKVPIHTQPSVPPRPPEQVVHYPVMMDPERQHLLALWSQAWSPIQCGPERHLHPVVWIDQVLPVALKHPPLFQALLATSACMWAMAHTTLNEATARQLQMADQILNQTCTTPAAASCDESLLAALLQMLVHQAHGNTHETDQRFSAIVGLVKLRGGPHYLGISGVVADVLLYADFLQAVVLDCEPVWTLPLPALQIGLPPRLGAEFRELLAANRLNVDLLLAADSVCRMTDMFEQQPQLDAGATGLGVLNSFGYLSTVSEYQLAHCNAILHGSSTWNECICLALLLFNHVILRHHGALTAPMRKLERQFWQTVDKTIVHDDACHIPPCLLLWLYMTGLSSCILADCQYRPAAVKKMRAVKIDAAITGWDHFQQRVLDDFVWLRAAQEQPFRKVWLEVEGYKTVP